MTRYPALDVHLAGWSGLAQADPTGRAVVVLDTFLPPDAVPGMLGDARPLVRRSETTEPRGCAAFDVDEKRIDKGAGTSIKDFADRIIRAAPIYRVGSVEIAPQPEFVIGWGKRHDVDEALDAILRTVAADPTQSVHSLQKDHEEEIGGGTHVYRLEQQLEEDGPFVGMIEPSVALAVVELSQQTTHGIRFEVPSFQRFEGEVAAPLEGAEPIDNDQTIRYIQYKHLLSADPQSPDPELIAVVDGYFERHPALEFAEQGVDTLAWTAQGKDAHGMACAGVAAAKGMPDEEIPPGAFEGAKILPVRVYDPAVRAHDELALARGIIGAVKMGASVISVSLARPAQTSTVVDAALQYAESHERVVVAASGNPREGEDDYQVWYPARYPTVIAVGAARKGDGPLERVTDAWPVGPRSASPRDEVRWSSAYGPELDLVAQGERVPTVDLRGLSGEDDADYWLDFRGTSAAAPVVAGVAARLRRDEGLQTAAEVRDRIAEIAEQPARVASPGFNVTRPTEIGNAYPYSEQLGYGWIERTSAGDSPVG